ncbi:MAG: MFS transporter [Flavobacteriales bacterium]|nr:MFS transporter [Flavobacteriales bacterium]
MNALANAYRYYAASFAGFSRSIWLLTFATFVNRAGTMVVPFLSLYLTKDMGLTLEQVGWIMSCFGAGSVVGSWLGGRLTDRWGHRPVMVGALVTSGLAFIGLQYVRGFLPFCAGVFALMVLSDAFRPAMFVAIRGYAPPDQRTRAVTLIRLAINLGFSLGPAFGGFIIAHGGFAGLFWADALTCLAAALILWSGLPRMDARSVKAGSDGAATASPYRDGPYLLFLVIVALSSIPFLQYFSSVPLFYSQVHGLSEETIGLLLGSNGLLIFLTEMPLVRLCEDRRFRVHTILRVSVLLIAISFALLNLVPTVAFLWVGMMFMTVGEMLFFPFTNRMANERADRGRPGAYMALYTIAWSVAHIVGHSLGLNLIAWAGYTSTWWICAAVLVVCAGLLVVLERRMQEGPRSDAP